MTLYAGLMSGTSLDGVDGVLVDFEPSPPRVLAAAHRPFDPPLRSEALALNTAGADELHRGALFANRLADLSAEVVATLLADAGVAADAVRAIGSHGQTVRHRPELGYTLQLHNGARLAERTGIDVVCDFRSRDVAAGGQGAPLVPAFHADVFGADEHRAVLNLGGIANLTLLPPDGPVLGFDTGPANLLLDGWIARHQGTAYDAGGRWAASGQVDAALLATLLAEPFLAFAPPKSTGRDLFGLDWLATKLAAHPATAPVDVQATLAEFTAASVAQALLRHAPATTRLLVCGGGAFNADLMKRLARRLPAAHVESTSAAGFDPQHVEATAFAWLARAFVERRPGNRPEVTGASGPRVLGALYPAR